MNSAKSALLARNSPLVHDALSQTLSVARAYQEAQEDLFFFFFYSFSDHFSSTGAGDVASTVGQGFIDVLLIVHFGA